MAKIKRALDRTYAERKEREMDKNNNGMVPERKKKN